MDKTKLPHSLLEVNQYFDIVDTAKESTVDKVSNEPDKAYFEQIITLLESKLTEFKIEGEIVNVLKDPVVDTFEYRPGAGVKVSKITGLADDLSLALYGAPIRVVPAMSGKDTVGIEVPRNPRDKIHRHFNARNLRVILHPYRDLYCLGEPVIVRK